MTGSASEENLTRATVYCRTSTDEQTKSGSSIETHLRRIASYADGTGWDPFESFVDGDFSGRTAKRSILQLMERLRESDITLVYKFGDLARPRHLTSSEWRPL